MRNRCFRNHNPRKSTAYLTSPFHNFFSPLVNHVVATHKNVFDRKCAVRKHWLGCWKWQCLDTMSTCIYKLPHNDQSTSSNVVDYRLPAPTNYDETRIYQGWIMTVMNVDSRERINTKVKDVIIFMQFYFYVEAVGTPEGLPTRSFSFCCQGSWLLQPKCVLTTKWCQSLMFGP